MSCYIGLLMHKNRSFSICLTLHFLYWNAWQVTQERNKSNKVALIPYLANVILDVQCPIESKCYDSSFHCMFLINVFFRRIRYIEGKPFFFHFRQTYSFTR